MASVQISDRGAGVLSAAMGLLFLMVCLYVLNEVLPSLQKQRSLSGELMTLLEPEQEQVASEDVQKETAEEQKPVADELMPLDLLNTGRDLALDASALFSLGSGSLGMGSRVMDELNHAEDVSRLDDVPRQLSAGAPLVYPTQARSKGIEGYVTLSLLVAKDGRILKALLLDSQPKGVFEEPALAAARSWVFSPPKRNNEAVQVWLKQTIRFDLED